MTKTVADVMTRNVVAVRRHAEFKEILMVMRRRHFSAFPVLDSGDKVIGLVSGADLLLREAYPADGKSAGSVVRRRDQAKVAALTAGDLMTGPAVTIGPQKTVAQAARLMYSKHIKRLPVVDSDRRLIGIVSRADLLGVYDRPDADIRNEIVDRIAESGVSLDAGRVEVMVATGVVTIGGSVDGEDAAVGLLDTVRQVGGVVHVRDRLCYPRHLPHPDRQLLAPAENNCQWQQPAIIPRRRTLSHCHSHDAGSAGRTGPAITTHVVPDTPPANAAGRRPR
jgi:CBS domain-containing protein